jgi:hypothetical protein
LVQIVWWDITLVDVVRQDELSAASAWPESAGMVRVMRHLPEK